MGIHVQKHDKTANDISRIIERDFRKGVINKLIGLIGETDLSDDSSSELGHKPKSIQAHQPDVVLDSTYQGENAEKKTKAAENGLINKEAIVDINDLVIVKIKCRTWDGGEGD
jgi:hypothetical protein